MAPNERRFGSRGGRVVTPEEYEAAWRARQTGSRPGNWFVRTDLKQHSRFSKRIAVKLRLTNRGWARFLCAQGNMNLPLVCLQKQLEHRKSLGCEAKPSMHFW